MEKRSVRRAQSASFVFDGIGSKHYQGQRLPAREDRMSNRRLAGLCLAGVDQWEGPAVHSLVALQSSWLRKTRDAQRCGPQGGPCTTMMGDRESQMFSLYFPIVLMTDRKKSRPNEVRLVSSCMRVRLCLPGPRLVLDQSNRWDKLKWLLAVNRCGVEPSIDTLKKPYPGPTSL